jgi:hypothetical protein
MIELVHPSLMVSLSNHEAGAPSSFDKLRMRASGGTGCRVFAVAP